MEEKSLLGRLYLSRKRGGSRVDENDGLSEYSRSESPSKSSWLPDSLRRRMSRKTFDDLDNRQTYPVMDWLKEIRLSCDLYDVGLPMKNNNDDESARRDEHWSSSEKSEDWNYVEETIIDEGFDGVTKVLSRTNGQESRDIEYGNNVCRIDKESEIEEALPVECENDLCGIDEAFEIEEEEDEIEGEQSNSEDQHAHDRSSERKNETCLTRSAFDKIYGSSTNDLSSMRDSSVTRCFRLESEYSKSFGLNNSSRAIELSVLLFCTDDDRALKYCDRYYTENNEELLNDFSRSPAGTSRTSECSTDDFDATPESDDEMCPYDSLEINLNRIEEEPFSSDFEIDESHFQTTRFYQNYISVESTMPDALWNDPPELIEDARFNRGFCVPSMVIIFL